MPSNPTPSKAAQAAQGNPAAALAATAAALPAANVAPPQGKGGPGYMLANLQPGGTYGVRVPHPTAPGQTLVLPFTLPSNAPKGCAVMVYGAAWWLGQNGKGSHWHVYPAPYKGMGVVLYPFAHNRNPSVAYACRAYASGLTVHGAPYVPLPKP